MFSDLACARPLPPLSGRIAHTWEEVSHLRLISIISEMGYNHTMCARALATWSLGCNGAGGFFWGGGQTRRHLLQGCLSGILCSLHFALCCG